MIRFLAVLMFMIAALTALYAAAASDVDVPPRELAPYVQRRLGDHHPLLASVGDWVAQTLTQLDRGEPRLPSPRVLRIGAQAQAPIVAAGRRVDVDSLEDAAQALRQARPGDVITLQPGRYAMLSTIEAIEAGTADARITFRAEKPGTVIIESHTTEAFLVSGPYWTFENLTVRGACERHDDCEHAFHVVGRAVRTLLRNNTLVDFNAHLKINGNRRQFPDHGTIEGNTLADTAPRRTDRPVTPIDLVGASGWTIRSNLITDFVKAGGDRISYGAFAKGGGSANRFERNVILCEDKLAGEPGWRVGLSLGGGGSGNVCRNGPCVTEQEDGVIESNLVAACSDDGIYLNRAAMSRIVHNTLLDTGGISVRFPESSADVQGNLVDGTIRARDGASLHAEDNLASGMAALYFGRHGWRRLYRDAAANDLAWSEPPPRRPAAAAAGAGTADLCGVQRPPGAVYGAFEDFSACLSERMSPADAAK